MNALTLTRAHGAAVARRPRGTILAFALLASVLAGRVVLNLNVPGKPSADGWALQDFRDAVYYPVVALLDGNNPYDATRYREIYPVVQAFPPYAPSTLLVHLPLGLLPYETAEVLYFALALVLVLVLARIAVEAAGKATTPSAVFGVATLVLFSRPGHQNLLVGQCTLEVVIGASAAWLYARRDPWLAGLALALATIKPTIGVPLLVLLLAAGATRPVLVGALVGGVASAVVLVPLVSIAGGPAAFLRALGSSYTALATESTSHPATSWGRIDALLLASRLTGGAHRPALAMALSTVLLGLGAVGVRRLATRVGAGARHLAFTLTSVTVLVCTYHQAYDLLLLTVPVTALVAGTPDVAWNGRPLARAALAALLLFPGVNYVATATVIRTFGIHGSWWSLVTSLNSAALLGAFLLSLTLALSATERGDA